LQAFPDPGETVTEHVDPVRWQDYWDCQSCSYPDRTGDLRSIVTNADFYSARQWHSTRCGIYRPMGFEHDLMLTLPATSGSVPERGRTMRLFFFRGLGPDFSERDRALLTLVRPHLYQACVDAERRRHPVPQLTPRHWDLLRLVAAGHTNTQIARRLGITEGTVGTHLENIYTRLNVSNRTAAVTRAFPDRLQPTRMPPSSPSCHIRARTGGKLTGPSGHLRVARAASDLDTCRLTPCVKRPSKQRVAGSNPAGRASETPGQHMYG
jgi:DNA-binding CsgD family transcriptional regulator